MNKHDSPLIENWEWLAPPAENASALPPHIVIAMVLVAALVVAGSLLYLRKTDAKNLPFLHPLPPHEKARRDLLKLEKQVREGNGKAFAAQVSLIIRVYIQERFGLRAPHRSTEEFLQEARRGRVLEGPQHDLLEEFLGACDLVKFAGLYADLAMQKNLLRTAQNFVAGTTPEETKS